MKLTREQAMELAAQVVADCQGGMRVVIGDRTTRQYDRADQMAGYIKNATLRALHRQGYTEEDYSYS